MRPTLVLAALTILAACQPARSPAPVADAITVTLAGQPDAVQRRVQAAAVGGGWTVAGSEPGVVTLAPYQPSGAGVIRLTLRANVVAAGADSSRVVVRGTATNPAMRAFGATAAEVTADQPVTSRRQGAERALWGEVERFAAALRPASVP